ncbi:hypothetical protein HDU79_005010 [Rhizoclosmatium sp. JEL0117]|nr:hypothetical protein HDU79_005010 [Rhizoclosmatium sp. JEL0117]
MISSVEFINDQGNAMYEETEANQDQAVPDLSNAGITMNGLSPASSRSVSTRVDIRDIGDEKELEVPDSDKQVIPSVTDAKGTADQIEKEPSMKFKKWFRPFFNFFQKYYLSLLERETAWDDWVKTQQLDRPDVTEDVLIREAMDWPKDKKPLPPLGLTSTEKHDLSELKKTLNALETNPNSETLVNAITSTDGYKEFEKQLTDEVIEKSFEVLGTLLGLCPLIPNQVSEFVGTIGKKIIDYKDKEAKAEKLFQALIEEGQIFMELLSNTELNLKNLDRETKDVDLRSATVTFQAIIKSSSERYGKIFGDCCIELRRMTTSTKSSMWETVSGFLQKQANPDDLREKLAIVRNGIRDEIIFYIGITTGKTLEAVRGGFQILEKIKNEKEALKTELDNLTKKYALAEANIDTLTKIFDKRRLVHAYLGDEYDALKPHLIHTALVFEHLEVENCKEISKTVKEAVKLINSLSWGKELARDYFPDFDGLTDFVVRVPVQGTLGKFNGTTNYSYKFNEEGKLNVMTKSRILKTHHDEIINKQIKNYKDFLLE